jgi:hypothetical protein
MALEVRETRLFMEAGDCFEVWDPERGGGALRKREVLMGLVSGRILGKNGELF